MFISTFVAIFQHSENLNFIVTLRLWQSTTAVTIRFVTDQYDTKMKNPFKWRETVGREVYGRRE